MPLAIDLSGDGDRKCPARGRPHLVVFFTRGMSLEGWYQTGILERELTLYRALAQDLSALTFVTYGDANDARWAKSAPGLDVLSNHWRLPGNLYSLLAPFLHWRRLRKASLFRTNQINGAWTGVIAKFLFRKPLIVRGGYLWADGVARSTSHRVRRTIVRALERWAFRSADRVVVAGDVDADAVERYGVDRASRIVVVPNFVDFSRFHPLDHVQPQRGRVVFVGRLEYPKNLEALMQAMQSLPAATLTVAGDGSLRNDLERQARALGTSVEFLGRVPHERLPEVLCGSEIFILPSRWEGNPKALFEAMACGVPVIGTRVPGIEPNVTDGVTGMLCGPSAEEIRTALERLLDDGPLRDRLRAAALAWVRERCALSVAVDRERALLASLA